MNTATSRVEKFSIIDNMKFSYFTKFYLFFNVIFVCLLRHASSMDTIIKIYLIRLIINDVSHFFCLVIFLFVHLKFWICLIKIYLCVYFTTIGIFPRMNSLTLSRKEIVLSYCSKKFYRTFPKSSNITSLNCLPLLQNKLLVICLIYQAYYWRYQRITHKHCNYLQR
jgi:hypothetical protein